MFSFKKKSSLPVYQETDFFELYESLKKKEDSSDARAFKYLLSNCRMDNVREIFAVLNLLLPAQDVQSFLVRLKEVEKRANTILLVCIVYYHYRLRMTDADQRAQIENAIHFQTIMLDSTLKLADLHAVWDKIYVKRKKISVDDLYSYARKEYLEKNVPKSSFESRLELFNIPLIKKPIDNYRVIGEGASAHIYQEAATYENSSQAVIKVIHMPNGSFYPKKLKNEMCKLMIELSILSELKHSNIVNFQGAYSSLGGSKLGFCMEYVQMDLAKLIFCPVMITEISGAYYADLYNLTDAFKTKIMRDILSGLDHIHKHGITHCDIKGQNILLSVPDSSHVNAAQCPTDSITVKIADFGLAERRQYPQYCFRGTTDYIAPEILQAYRFQQKQYAHPYSPASDMYAFAIVAFEMCIRELPFKKIKNTEKYVVTYGRPKAIHRVDDRYKHVIQETWKHDPKARLTANQALHFFLQF